MNKQQWTFAVAVACVWAMATPAAHASGSASAPPVAASAEPASNHALNRKAARAADRKLAYAVRKGIEHVKGLDATRIAVVAHNGNVTLTGTVPDQNQIGLAVARAQAVPGVAAVVNRLDVGEVAP
jgi:hyperosmotically inducible periplasmic protein